MVLDFIKAHHPALDVELLTMKTTGDIILDRTLDKVGGKGLFVKELDRALMDRSDLSVHSLKDMPMEVPEASSGGFFKKKDPRDVLVLPRCGNWIFKTHRLFQPAADPSAETFFRKRNFSPSGETY